MRPTLWGRLEAIFFEALEVPPDERPAYVRQACGDDAELRGEVEAVLAAHDALEARGPDEVAPDRRIGTRVGPYELEELLGRGGMGEVYRARRADDQYEHEVAVKLVRPGLPPYEMVRRFRVERQILARLEHPGVATLLDGGVTEDGQPYLVMQFVRGVPIDQYDDAHRLTVAERLRLFVSVCRAVQFAHTNLVVHRDLKPSNILVTDDGRVRLLDFGIAKLLDPGDSAGVTRTESLLLLTPEHAAPEQFLGLPVTTATDVYQLGVLLYQLLTGTRPFRAGSSVELHRAICEGEPARPSTIAVDGPGGDPDPTVAVADAARLRGTTPEGLRRQLRGDLDRIVLKAVRKEPERRYASVADLADDVERHLGGFPVRARPEGFAYVASRFMRRHRAAVAVAVALAASLVTLVVTSLRFATATARQADDLQTERDVAVEVSSFLEGLFEASDPFSADAAGRDTLSLGGFLDEGAQRVRDGLSDQPLVQARLLGTLGRAYRNLGRFDDAAPVLAEAVAIREREGGVGTDPPELAVARIDLAQLRAATGGFEEAEALLSASIGALGPDSTTQARRLSTAYSALGDVYQDQGRYAEAEDAYRHALSLFALDPEPDDGRRAEHVSNLASALTRSARFTEAESLLVGAVALSRSALGDEHPTTATLLNNLGSVRMDLADLDGAEAPLREALAIRRARFQGPHPSVATSLNNVAQLLLARDDFDGAEVLFRESLEMRRALYGDEHPSTGIGWLNVAAVLQRSPDKHKEAISAYGEARTILVATLGPTHPYVGDIEGNLGRLHHDAGAHERALELYGEALRVRRETYDETHPIVLGNLSDIGRCLTDLERYGEAEDTLLRALEGLEPLREEQPRMYDTVLLRIVALYRATGRDVDATRYEQRRESGL